MLSNCGAGEDSWESLVLQGDQTSQSERKSTLNIHWEDWYFCWSSNILATWCKELAHWKRNPDSGKDWGQGTTEIGWLDSISDWMAMRLIKLQGILKDRENCVLRFMVLQRVRQDWAMELILSDDWFSKIKWSLSERVRIQIQIFLIPILMSIWRCYTNSDILDLFVSFSLL